MRIKLGDLRKLVKEVAMSPSLFVNNKPQSDPMEKKAIAAALQDLEHAFVSALVTDLVLSNPNAYNKQTRDFDDETYKSIEQSAKRLAEKLAAQTGSAVTAAWNAAHQKLSLVKKAA